jgi:monovalent cation/proton antiporter MnhG/PhaG subunit
MSVILELLSAALILAGASITAIAALGVARLPDPFMRMHAATKAGVAGSGLVLIGAAAGLGGAGAWITALCGVAFLVATTPIASHVLGRAAYVAGAPLSPTVVRDALSGIIDRRIFDVAPVREPNRRRTGMPGRQEDAMSVVEERRGMHPAAAVSPALPKQVLCWLVGGRAQGGAIDFAMNLSREAGAKLVGISALGLDGGPDHGIKPQAMPVGGVSWARWLADEKRARMRETASEAFRLFEEKTRGRLAEVSGRHEEGDLDALAAIVAGHDLAIVPAGIGPSMFEVPPADELASLLARRTATPILRVRRRPAEIRSVVMVVGSTPECWNLAGGLVRSGLWPSLPVSLLPVAERGPDGGAAAAVAEQAGLLRAHGHGVTVLDPAAPGDAAALASRVAGFDLAVMARLSNRSGWFGSLRSDPFETVAAVVPVTLLP